MPAIAVAPTQGKLLYLLARLQGARRILEIGTLGGYSTIWLARALPADGRLITLEYVAKHAEVAKANIARAKLADKVEIRVGQALAILPVLAAENAGPFDLVFIDADKANYVHYYEAALPLLAPAGLIVVDNVLWSGRVTQPPEDEATRGIVEFNRLIYSSKKLFSTILPVRDGFAVCEKL